MAKVDNIQRVLSRGRSRMTLLAWLQGLGWAALLCVVVSGIVMLTGRLLSLYIPMEIYIVLAVAAVAGSIIYAARHRPSLDEVAHILDARLGLKDRLGSAVYARRLEHSHDDTFARHVWSEAERSAEGLRVGQAIPLRVTRAWAYVPLALAVVVLLAVFVPVMDLAGLEASRNAVQQADAEAEQDEQEVAEAVAVLQQLAPSDSDELADWDSQTLEALRQLRELGERDVSTPEAREELTAQLSALEERLGTDLQQQEQQFEQIRNMLSALDPQQSGPADKFADALRRGDFSGAQAALQELSEAVADLPDDQKRALQQQLQVMQEQLEQIAEQQQQAAEQALEQMTQTLEQAGMSREDAQEMAEQFMNGEMTQEQLQQAIQQSLQQQNPNMSQEQSQQQAQQMAQQMQQQAQNCQSCQGSSGQASQMAQQMQAMQQMAQGQSPGQSQPGEGSSGGQQSQQAMQQLAQMQQQMSQMQQARQAAQQSLQQLGGGVGGREAGTGSGGDPLGQEQNRMRNYNVTRELTLGPERDAPPVASWMTQGGAEAGDAQVTYSEAVTEARSSAEHAIAEDRVPRRYHRSIKTYFDQLPQNIDEVERSPQTPRAPR